MDVAFFDHLNKIGWCSHSGGYAYATVKGKNILLHRYITCAADHQEVDHINGDKLDCRISNLRLCDHTFNMQNQKMHKDNKSGFKGVYESKQKHLKKKWCADIQVNKKRIRIGRFYSPWDAAVAYDEAARKYHGPYARLNFP